MKSVSYRYEDEINKRTDSENSFVLLKKVNYSLYFHSVLRTMFELRKLEK